jgi:hypothetical protein
MRERIGGDRIGKHREEVDALPEFEASLRIDLNALDEALQAQPDVYYRVSRKVALLTSRRDAAKKELELVEADMDAEVRKNSRRLEEKVTETEIKNRIARMPKAQEAWDQLHKLNAELGEWVALKGGFEQRSYALKDLTALHLANHYGDQQSLERNRVQKYDESRKALNERRRERG